MSDGSDCSVRSYNINHDCDTSERLCVFTQTQKTADSGKSVENMQR